MDISSNMSPHELPILVVSDSQLFTRQIVNKLRGMYLYITTTDNGREAWDYLMAAKDTQKPILTRVSCIITEAEMPILDGYRLTKLIKEDEILNVIPIILFTPDSAQNKANSLGVVAHLSRSAIDDLLPTVNSVLAPNYVRKT